MATNVVMPQMGESIAEGTIVRWIKKVGDSVDRDEPLFEISTDKVDAEIPSPAAGVLTEIKVKEGETVPVNSVVAVDRRGRREAAAEPPASGDAGHSRRKACPQPLSDSRRPAPSTKAPPSTTAPRSAEARPSDRGGTGAAPAGPPSKEELRRQKSSPLVRRIAKEHDVDIQQIQGTGISGRVTKQRHPRLHRVRRAEAGAGAAAARARAGAGPGVPAGRERPDRADERDAQEDRRAHGAQRAHVAARLLGVRGELRAGQRAARQAEGASTKPPARS